MQGFARKQHGTKCADEQELPTGQKKSDKKCSNPEGISISDQFAPDLSHQPSESSFWREREREEASSRAQKPDSHELTSILPHMQSSLDGILQKALLKFEQDLEAIVDKQLQRMQQTLEGLLSAKDDPVTR